MVENDLFVAAEEEEDPHLLYSTDQHRLEIQEGGGEGLRQSHNHLEVKE